MQNNILLLLKLTLLPALFGTILLLMSLLVGGVMAVDWGVDSLRYYGTLAVYLLAYSLPVGVVYALLAVWRNWRRNTIGCIKSSFCCAVLASCIVLVGEQIWGDGRIEWFWVGLLAAVGVCVGAMMSVFLPRDTVDMAGFR